MKKIKLSRLMIELVLFCWALGVTMVAAQIGEGIPGGSGSRKLLHANQLLGSSESESADVLTLGKQAPGAGKVINDIAMASIQPVVFDGVRLHIQNHQLQPVKIAIYDSKGRLVRHEQFGAQARIVLNVSALTRGVYVYTVSVGESLVSRPFMVTR
jgi:hypothetical protein